MFLLEMAENPVTLGDEFETELKIFTRTRKLVTNNPILPEKKYNIKTFYQLPVGILYSKLVRVVLEYRY